MATKGWKQPYSYDGNCVTTRRNGRREVVFVSSASGETEEFCLRANCDFQVETYGAVDSGASFAQAAKDRGYPLSYSRRREMAEQGLLNVRYGGYGRKPRATDGQQVTRVSIDTEEPNRILDCQVRTISISEAHLGILELDTEQGFIPLAINRNVAHLLIAELAAFMAAEQVDDVVQVPSNDG